MNRQRLLVGLALLLLGAGGWLLPRYSYVGALRPILTLLDEDDDDLVSPTEAARGSPMPINFHKVDRDEDGAISEPELVVHLLGEDPSRFDGEPDQRQPSPVDSNQYFSDPKPIRVMRVLFEFMAAEVRTSNHNFPLPTEAKILSAARTGSLDSPEALEVAGNLVAAYQAVHLEVPTFLAEIEPVMAENPGPVDGPPAAKQGEPHPGPPPHRGGAHAPGPPHQRGRQSSSPPNKRQR